MAELKSDLTTNEYTRIFYEDKAYQRYNAPHHFAVMAYGQQPPFKLATIHFQEGPIRECDVNGVANEDLIAMVICRLEHFQDSPYKCRENAIAITKLQEALMWLCKRTNGREARGVEGTNAI